MKPFYTIMFVTLLVLSGCTPNVADAPGVPKQLISNNSSTNPTRTGISVDELPAPDMKPAAKQTAAAAVITAEESYTLEPVRKAAKAPAAVAEQVKAGTGLHIVAPKETLYGIARSYNVGVDALAKENGLTTSSSLKIGDTLRIPGVGKPRADAPPADVLTQQMASSTNVTKRFIWPLQGGKIIEEFGMVDKGQKNEGIAIAAPKGSNVLAADNGIVAYVGNKIKGFGNLVLLRHAGGYLTAYAHNDSITVAPSDYVKRGQVIAKVGNTGTIDTPQLFFQLRKGRTALNPPALRLRCNR
jgi:LysM repeat protein